MGAVLIPHHIIPGLYLGGVNFSGKFHTIYLASSDVIVTEENSEFRMLMREVKFFKNYTLMSMKFYVRRNGKCQLHTVWANKSPFKFCFTKSLFDNVKCSKKNENEFIIGSWALRDAHRHFPSIYLYPQFQGGLTRPTGTNITEEVWKDYVNLTRHYEIPIKNIKNVYEAAKETNTTGEVWKDYVKLAHDHKIPIENIENVYEAASKYESVIEENSQFRMLMREVKYFKNYKVMSMTFYVRNHGKCQLHTVWADKPRYKVCFRGWKFTQVQCQNQGSKNIIGNWLLRDVKRHFPETYSYPEAYGGITRPTGTNITEEMWQVYVNLTSSYEISTKNIKNVYESGDTFNPFKQYHSLVPKIQIYESLGLFFLKPPQIIMKIISSVQHPIVKILY
ncbi:hypothetical protein STEG23_029812 [Scotinomys teguina]